MFRTVWSYAVGVVVTFGWSFRIYLHRVTRSSRLDEITGRASREWGQAILWACGVRVRYENEELLPRDQAQVLVANHQSWFDVFALCATLPLDYRFVAKKELSKIPLFGQAWVTAGHYSIDRSDRQAAIASLNSVGGPMKANRHTVVLFPEGTRSDDGRLKTFKKGAFVMAIGAQVPIVPVAVLGSRDIMPKGRWRVRSGEITIRVGEPIATEGLTLQDRDRLTRLARQRVADLKGEVLPPEAPGPVELQEGPDRSAGLEDSPPSGHRVEKPSEGQLPEAGVIEG